MNSDEQTSSEAVQRPARPWPALLDDYPGVIELPVQWGDQDAYGHVNNAMYFRWFESARAAYAELVGMDFLAVESATGPILASTQCNFRRQVKFPDWMLVGARVAKMRAGSMTMEYVVYSTKQKMIVADGSAVVVTFDYANQRMVRIPDQLRADVERIEGRQF